MFGTLKDGLLQFAGSYGVWRQVRYGLADALLFPAVVYLKEFRLQPFAYWNVVQAEGGIRRDYGQQECAHGNKYVG